MKTIEDLRRYEENHRFADNFKMVVVGMMIVSVMAFAIMGDAAVKPIIWYWAGGMASLVGIAAILDFVAYRKDKNGRKV